MTQRFSKTTLALALAAGLMLPVLAAGPVLAHEEPCPPGFVLLGDLGSSREDRNDNNLLCTKSGLAPAHAIVIDDHVHSERDPE